MVGKKRKSGIKVKELKEAPNYIPQTISLEELEFVSPESSHIHSARYNPGGPYLKIIFHKSSAYLYLGVPLDIWIGFREADSKGRYFNLEIAGRFEEYKQVVIHNGL